VTKLMKLCAFTAIHEQILLLPTDSEA